MAAANGNKKKILKIKKYLAVKVAAISEAVSA
jgi:hypothetical protein